MTEPARWHPTSRFTGLADLYSKYRPSYPTQALDYIRSHCGLTTGAVVVDVGCGTGISSRLFAAQGFQVIGLEPNPEMRAAAEAEPAAPGYPKPIYQEGRAEATGLSDQCADAVVAAQAFHWFDSEAALREFHRILKPHGWAVLMWNERDETDPFTAAFGAVIRTAPEAVAVEQPRGRAGEPLLKSLWFQNAERVVFRNEQALDEEGVLGRAFSASYAPRDPDRAAEFAAALRSVFAHYQQDGRVLLHYETSVYLGRRRAGSLSEAQA